MRVAVFGLLLATAPGLLPAAPSAADPALVDPEAGLLELVTPPETAPRLQLVDGLAIDRFGNLFAALEIPGDLGGVVRVDTDSGAVSLVAEGISRADQVAMRPVAGSPDSEVSTIIVTSEVAPAAVSRRLFRVNLYYAPDGSPSALRPVLPIRTELAITNPEGLVVLESDGPYGAAGTVYVAEDVVGGRIFSVVPETRRTRLLRRMLGRPEGLAFGDFAGGAEPALYAAETQLHRVIRIDPDGAVSALGDPAAVGLVFPDNLEFGPDGFLYVSEDRPEPQSRIVRVAADGAHEVFATGFGQAAGLAFDPLTGDLYVSEQDLARIWRVRFARAARIDLRPGNRHNWIRLGVPSLVGVAIFGAPDLDALEIDLASLALGPAGAPAIGARGPARDVDGDGLVDLVVRFRADASGVADGDEEICLRGALLDGRPFRGCDAIQTLPPGRPASARRPGAPGR